jgi:hypothetical protein
MLDLSTAPLVLIAQEVVLSPLTLEHVPALALAAAESRQHYGFNPVPNGATEAHEYVTRALDGRAVGERYPFAISWRSRIVGTTSYAD